MIGPRRRRPGRRGAASSGSTKTLDSNNGQFSARDSRYMLCENEIWCAFFAMFFFVFLNVAGTKQ